MRKTEDLYVEKTYDAAEHQRRPQRQLFVVATRAFWAVIFVLFSAKWLSEHGIPFTGHRHVCAGSLTIEERAAKILKENPLIGQHLLARFIVNMLTI